jgi:transcriptional regulator with XRE-family HTH domain
VRQLPPIPDDYSEDPPVRHTAALRALLEQAIARVGSPAELARQLEVAPSHVARIRQGLVGAGFIVLLNLADVLDEDALKILRLCGHARLAERFVLLQQPSVPRSRTKLYDAIDSLSVLDRDLVAAIVKRLQPPLEAEPLRVAPLADPPTRSRR